MATSSNPPCPWAKTSGTPVSGFEIAPSSDTSRSLLGRSVTSICPSGRKANPQGFWSPFPTVSTLTNPALVGSVRFSAKLGCEKSISAAVHGKSKYRCHPLGDLHRVASVRFIFPCGLDFRRKAQSTKPNLVPKVRSRDESHRPERRSKGLDARKEKAQGRERAWVTLRRVWPPFRRRSL
jgi:hypothetical protein